MREALADRPDRAVLSDGDDGPGQSRGVVSETSDPPGRSVAMSVRKILTLTLKTMTVRPTAMIPTNDAAVRMAFTLLTVRKPVAVKAP